MTSAAFAGTLPAWLLLAACAAPSFAQGAAGEDLRYWTDAELFETGSQRLERGEAGAAIPFLSRAVARRPDDLRYALRLVSAYRADGQREAAANLLANLDARFPQDAQVRLAQATLSADAADWPRVRERLAPLRQALEPPGLLLLARAHAAGGQAPLEQSVLRGGVARFPADGSLRDALVDSAIARGQFALALRHVAEARRALGDTAERSLRAALAYLGVGRALGDVQARRVADGREGAFHRGWLLVDRRGETDTFLCAPADSALYQVRCALDAGLDTPAAHLLHARILLAAGRPQVALAVLRQHEPLLLRAADEDTLAVYADVALGADRPAAFLRYVNMRAARAPRQREEILFQAYLALAERYSRAGAEFMCREFLRRAAELRPDDVAVALRFADALWSAERKDEARKWYLRVLGLSPAHVERGRIERRIANE